MVVGLKQLHMSDSNMPVTEAVTADERELVAYEIAYHVLPTVAEGEVDSVTAELKNFITTAGGQIFDEEQAERFELAYEIEKYLEGRYRKFGSAYFGWVRFHLEPKALGEVTEHIEGHKSVLRSLTIRLTKAEEQNPFRFHESIADIKVRNITIADEDVVEGDEVAEEVVDAILVGDEKAEEVVK
jgi:ribosomal protein S6